MNKFELTRKIERFAPTDTQEKWDCSGWLVCTEKKDVSKVMIALTVTDDVVAQAKNNGCDMILSHHPLFCVPLEYSDIDIYCAHTNMDKAVGGTTDTLIKTLGLKTDEIVDDFVRIVCLNTSVSVKEFAEKLRTISPNLRYINNRNLQTIKTIGFCAGSGSEFINECDVDAFVTGDLKFHTALEAEPVVYDIGHFESEILIRQVLKDIIGVEAVFASEKTPFIY